VSGRAFILHAVLIVPWTAVSTVLAALYLIEHWR